MFKRALQRMFSPRARLLQNRNRIPFPRSGPSAHGSFTAIAKTRLRGKTVCWTFEISTGKLYDPQGNFVVKGYSGGNCGINPEGIDNPQDESVPCIGPIPEGLYTLGEPVLQSPRLGPFAIPLSPAPSNQMFGRGGFYCHGDSVQHPGNASEGCIIMPPQWRQAMWNSQDHQLEVVARIGSVPADESNPFAAPA